MLRPELGDETRGGGGASQCAALGDIVTQRLLTIDMFAGSQRCQGDGRVHVIRHGDADRVDPAALLRQHFPPVGVAPRFRHQHGGFVELLAIHVAECDHATPRMLEKLLQIVAPHHAADADAGVVEALVRRDTPREGSAGAARSQRPERGRSAEL